MLVLQSTGSTEQKGCVQISCTHTTLTFPFAWVLPACSYKMSGAQPPELFEELFDQICSSKGA